MVFSQLGFADRHGAAVERLSLGELSLLRLNASKILHRCRHLGVILAQRLTD
jgi:hypothetical protein